MCSSTRSSIYKPKVPEPFIVLALAVAGEKIFGASCDKAVHVWHAATCTHLGVCEGHTGWVLAVCADPLVKAVFSAGEDRTIRAWDPASHCQLQSLQGHTDRINSVLLAAGRVFSASDDGTVRAWNAQSYEAIAIMEGHSDCVCCLAADEERVYSGSDDNTVRVWDCLSLAHLGTLSGHWDCIRTLALGGSLLFSGSDDTTIHVWDARTFAHKGALLGHTEPVSAVVASGGIVYSGSSSEFGVRTWCSDSLQPTCTLQGHREGITGLVAAGNRLYSASNDASVRMWDVGEGVTSGLESTALEVPPRSRDRNRIPDESKRWGPQDLFDSINELLEVAAEENEAEPVSPGALLEGEENMPNGEEDPQGALQHTPNPLFTPRGGAVSPEDMERVLEAFE